MKRIPILGLVVLTLALSPMVSAYKETDHIDTNESTHQFINDQIPVILWNDGYPYLSKYFSGPNLEQMKRGSIRADETIWDSREHYMHPSSHEGFLGFKSAGQLARERFSAAISHWNSGNRNSALYELGWAMHLVQDLTVPHHAALTALDYHSEYEQWVLDNQYKYYVTSGGIYNFDSYLPGHYDDESDPFDWVDYNAHYSYDHFSYVNGPNGQDGNDYDYAASLLLSRAQRTSAGFVFMFLSTVNSVPVANAGGDKSAGQRELILFDGLLSSDDIAIVNFTWNFGDGTYGYGVEVTHDYSEPGLYDAHLTVRDSFGEESTDFFEIVVVDTEPPIAYAGEDVYVSEGEAVILNSSGSSDNVGIAEYCWLLEDLVIGNSPTLEYSFNGFGAYIITLRVEDEAGNFDTDTVVVVIADVTPPHADAGSNLTLEVGQNWSFDASNSTDNNEIVSYVWNFGDGFTGTGMIVDHSYGDEGTFIVTLVVMDVSGNVDKSRIVVNVTERSSVDISSQNDLPLFVLLSLVAVVIVIIAMILMRRKRPESKG